MTPVHVEDLLFGTGAVLLLIGALAATVSSNPLKRVAGVALALSGAVSALAALHVGEAALLAGAGAAFALSALGVALAVRLQEAYGGGDAAEFDAADQAVEPVERGS